MWVPSVLCLGLFLIFAYVTSLCFAVLLFMLKFYPLSHPFVHLCLRKFSLSRLPARVKSCFYFSPFFSLFKAPACQQDVITLQRKFCLTVFFPFETFLHLPSALHLTLVVSSSLLINFMFYGSKFIYNVYICL